MKKSHMPVAKIGNRTGLQAFVSDTALNRWNEDLRAMESSEDDKTEISILEFIGEDFWGDGVSARKISSQLRAIGDRDVIVNINSPGGNFFEGLAIYNLLRQHKGSVTVKVIGIAASAAAVIAMAGDTIQIARSGFFMIHNVWVCACGDRHELAEAAAWLEPFDTAAVDIFVARTGLKEKDVAAMCDRETWISGKQAVDDGFADDFLDADQIINDANNSNSVKPRAAAQRIDQLLSKLSVPRSERRSLVASLKNSGTPSAAEDAKQDAGKKAALAALTAKIDAL